MGTYVYVVRAKGRNFAGLLQFSPTDDLDCFPSKKIVSAFVREEKIGSELQKLLISSTIMQAIVANVENVHFEVEMQINMQLGTLPLPFSGMDSK